MENESGDSLAIASAKLPDRAETASEKQKAKVDSLSVIEGSKNRDPQVETRRAVSPRARRLAAELGIDATTLHGSGRTGRISEKDVREAVNAISSPGLSVMRRTIAQRTAASFASTPHFYLRCEVDATELIRLREDLLPQIESRSGVRLTLTDLLLRAQARALKAFPAANAVWAGHNIERLPNCDVGLVVGLEDGMRIPIMRSADTGDLGTLAKQRYALVESARTGKLPLEAMQGGATSLSNLGNTRVDEFAAIILPCQSSILAVGRASPRPFALDGQLTVRPTLRLCLSVDHRVLDGAPAAEFFGAIIQLLEEPGELV
jgi:pyruvate dehydrogenase E2 component (dihydrolipoamide acetyltransferase)